MVSNSKKNQLPVELMDFAFVEGVVVVVSGPVGDVDEVVLAFDHMEELVAVVGHDQLVLYFPMELAFHDDFLYDESRHSCA